MEENKDLENPKEEIVPVEVKAKSYEFDNHENRELSK